METKCLYIVRPHIGVPNQIQISSLSTQKPKYCYLLKPFIMSRDSYPSYSSSHSQSPLPIHLWFLLGMFFMFVSFSWYLNCESLFEGFFNQINLLLIVSPLLLLLVLYLLSNYDNTLSSFLVPLPEKDSFHRAGGTPWGVALVLVLLLFLLSYQSDFRERWFPLLSRWIGGKTVILMSNVTNTWNIDLCNFFFFLMYHIFICMYVFWSVYKG